MFGHHLLSPGSDSGTVPNALLLSYLDPLQGPSTSVYYYHLFEDEEAGTLNLNLSGSRQCALNPFLCNLQVNRKWGLGSRPVTEQGLHVCSRPHLCHDGEDSTGVPGSPKSKGGGQGKGHMRTGAQFHLGEAWQILAGYPILCREREGSSHGGQWACWAAGASPG